MLAGASTATAAEIMEFPVGGDPAQVVWALAPGTDGSVFFAQQWVGTGSTSPGDRMRVGKVDAAGHLVASSEITGNAGWSVLAPTSDGGAWLLHVGQPDGLAHVAANGAVSDVASAADVNHAQLELAVGDGDDAWMLGCATSCSAVRVALNGTVTRYALPGFATPSGSFGWGDIKVVAVDGGVWLSRTVDGAAQAAFVSSSGAVTGVTLPSGAAVVAAARGDEVWWQQQAPQRIGRISTAGAVTGVRDLNADQGQHVASAGARDGGVLWAQDVTAGSDRDGRLGAFGEAGDRSFDVPFGASAVQEGPNFYSGSCTFGGGPLTVAVDGAAWIVSTGHPDRISRQTPLGAFTTFVVPSANGDTSLRIRDVAEASTGDLWFAVETSAGPRLARADPRNPPQGLPGWPRDSTASGGRDARLRLSIRRLRGHRLRLRATVARAARGRIRVRVRFQRRTITRSTSRRVLTLTVRGRGKARVKASFVGQDTWRSRTLRTRMLSVR
jgi:hypothetical protein